MTKIVSQNFFYRKQFHLEIKYSVCLQLIISLCHFVYKIDIYFFLSWPWNVSQGFNFFNEGLT